MPNGTLQMIESNQKPRVYPANIQPLMQSLLATLANIDFVHEREIEKLRNSATDVSLRETLIAVLEEGHEKRRQPYLEGLAALESDIRSLLLRSGSAE